MKVNQLAARLAPMVIVSFFSSVQGVVLPQVIRTLELSLSQASLLVGVIQTTGFISMIGGGFFIDRLGSVGVLIASIGLFVLAALTGAAAATWMLVLIAFGLMGMGVALIGTSVNTLMAQTGERRAFFLGVMHSTFSLVSIGAPLVAGVAVQSGPWRRYYLFLAMLAAAIGAVVYMRERRDLEDRRRGRRTRRVELQGKAASRRSHAADTSAAVVDDGSTTQKNMGAVESVAAGWGALRSIYPICLGVFCLVGMQSTLVTWGYLYSVDVYGLSHTWATGAVALLWVGISAGRIGNIPLSTRRAPRSLLTWAAAFSLVALGVEWIRPSPVSVLILMPLLGAGVSGAFQLGTAWAAGITPKSVGAASSFVMASATLGGAVWPGLAGVLGDFTGIGVVRWLLAIGFGLAWLTFAVAGGFFRPVGLRRPTQKPGAAPWS